MIRRKRTVTPTGRDGTPQAGAGRWAVLRGGALTLVAATTLVLTGVVAALPSGAVTTTGKGTAAKITASTGNVPAAGGGVSTPARPGTVKPPAAMGGSKKASTQTGKKPTSADALRLAAATSTVSGGTITALTPVTTKLAVVGQDVKYTFGATAGRHVSFDLTAVVMGSGSATLNFYDPTGTYVTYCRFYNTPTYCDFSPSVTGTWTLDVVPDGSSLGTFTFTYAPDQLNGAMTAGTPSVTTFKNKGQAAHWTFAATAGVHLTFAIQEMNLGGGSGVLNFYTPAGTYITYCRFYGPTYCDFAPGVSGTWSVYDDPDGGAIGSTGITYAPDQNKGTLVAGTQLSTSITLAGQAAKYTFPATSGAHVTFAIQEVNWGGGSATLNFYSPAGTYVTYCRFYGTATWCEFTPTATGNWTLVLDPDGGAVGTTAFTFAPDQNKGPMTSGATSHLTFTLSGQAAKYTFTGTTGSHVTFAFPEVNWNGGSAVLSLTDPSGTAFATCRYYGPNYCDYALNRTGTWTMTIDPDSGTVGTSDVVFANDQAGGALSAGVVNTATIQIAGQNAVYTLSGTANKAVPVSVLDANWGSGSAVVGFYSPLGALITSCRVYSSPISCSATPTTSGTLTLRIDPDSAATGATQFRLN